MALISGRIGENVMATRSDRNRTPYPRYHQVTNHGNAKFNHNTRTDYDQRLWPVPGKPVLVLRTARDLADYPIKLEGHGTG
jgi:hypothetical protein